MTELLEFQAELSVSAVHDTQTGEPLIELSLPRRLLRLSPTVAALLGEQLVRSAHHTQSEAFLAEWTRGAGFSAEQIQQLLVEYQRWVKERVV